MTRPSTKHTRMAICLFDTEFRHREGTYRESDQRGGAGDVQKLEEDAIELLADEEEDASDCREK